MKATPLIFGAAAAVFGSTMLSAQSNWLGGGTNDSRALWSDSANWSGTVPVDGSTISLVFNNTSANSFSNNNLAGLTLSGITVPATFNTVNVKDNNVTGNAVTLGGSIVVDTGNWQTFGFGMELGATRSVTVNNGQLTLSGNLTGAGGSVTKGGGGTLVISGNNSLGAATRLNISSGTVHLDSTSALGAAGGSISFAGGAALSIRSNSAINSYNLGGGSSVTASSVTLGRQSSGPAFTQNFGVLELGSRTMTFNQGANISSGTMVANVSELRMTAGNNDRPVLLNGSATMQIGSASITNIGILKRLQLDGTSASNSIGTISNGISGAVIELIKDNSSTWTLTSNNSYTGGTTITAGVLQLGNGGTTGALSTSSAITNNATLAFNRSDTITQGTDFASTISGAGSLRKSGAGNLVLTGSNLASGTAREVLTFSGGGSGTVTVRNSAALGAAGNTIRFSGNSSGVLDLQTDGSVNAYHVASGTGHGGTIIANRATSGSSITHTLGNLDLSSVTLTVNRGSNVTGSAAVFFTELRMSGGNDNNPVTLGGDADITIGSASITNNGMSKRLQLDGTSANNVVSGVISDTNNGTVGTVTNPTKVNLIKSNSSTWTLQANNTYTGSTTIKGGTLKINSSTAIASSPLITVGDEGSSGAVLDASSGGFAIGAGQTLGGIGKILATGQTVTASGTIAPGNSVGTIRIDGGSLVLNGNSRFNFELGTSSDLVSLLNLASLDLGNGVIGLGDFSFTDSGGFGPGAYTLIGGAGSFAGFLDPGDVSGSVLGFDSTLGMSGNDLVLTVIPEPAVILLGPAGLALLARRRRSA